MGSGGSAPGELIESICRENLSVYRESAGRLQEDVSQESQVAHDYQGRLVYELLQNADDAFADAATTADKALFRLTNTELWVANTGRPFTEADVRGLCGLGASSKTASHGPRRASIGHKGLGFKSVLEITESPEAYSETVSFRLGRNQASAQVSALWAERDRGIVRGVPAMRFPVGINEPHPTWLELNAAGYRTAFRFPFHDRVGGAQREALAEQLLTLPMTTVLFLKHLEEVSIEVEDATEPDSRHWLLERRRLTSTGWEACSGLTESGLFRVDLVNSAAESDGYWVAHNADVDIDGHRDGLSGPAWEGVDISEVSVAVRADDPHIDPERQRFHIFLPSEEPSGCSLLVNGAFTTDLSRQHVKVGPSALDYNSHLVRQAAQTFVDVLVPHLLRQRGAQYVLKVLERHRTAPDGASTRLAGALTEALADIPLLPSGDDVLTLGTAILPSPVLGSAGAEFAELLRQETEVEGRRFPDPEFCEGGLAAICASYGAVALSPADTLHVLAEGVDPAKSRTRSAPDPRLRSDPVLDLCVVLWELADAGDRHALESLARHEPVFPVGVNPDDSVRRIRLGEESAFYPPRSSPDDVPLSRLRFLAHALCWGTLGSTEQRSVLARQMKAWDALFEIQEFGFGPVMRTAVLPQLTRAAIADPEVRSANRSIESLAAICGLAGKTIKPELPLPLGRFGSDRPFVNLSRLEVPCRVEADGAVTWAPAYQVYFGRDWVGEDSVEEIADAMSAGGQTLDIRYLAGPEVFSRYSSAIGINAPMDENDQHEDETGEVGLDDDTDEALEATASERWLNFFAWLGVSRGLRLVHFKDVDDDGSWTSTKGLGQPNGWAFANLGRVWAEYEADILRSASTDARWAASDHYLYQVHNLDQLDEIAAAARLKDSDVAQRLIEHLVRNWDLYARHTRAQLALVGAGKLPGNRKPPRATPEELVTVGPDLWLYRLRQHAICPTSHGPRRPDQTWRRSKELERRLGRRHRQASDYLPVLEPLESLPTGALRNCLDELGVRGELTPTSFTLEDARDLCMRLAHIYREGVDEQSLSTEIRPLYRQVFELLVGTEADGAPALGDVPLAARTAQGIEFLPAADVVYASVSGSRERSGVQGRIPLFVLEAEPGATRPLRELFGTPVLETALEWSVDRGETIFTGLELEAFRAGLRALVPPLLARLGADRVDRRGTDALALQRLADELEPADSLTLTCRFSGQDLGAIPQRSYYVSRSPGLGFAAVVVWQGPPWPPVEEDAQTLAMAMAETLGVNSVETFLSFITAKPEQRLQLLELAGAAELLAEVERELAAAVDPEHEEERSSTSRADGGHDQTDGTSAEAAHAHASRPVGQVKAAPRVPLHRFEDLLIGGEVIHIMGTATGNTGTSGSQRERGDGTAGTTQAGGRAGGPRAATGTDLTELDRLGMRITIAFEYRRLSGCQVAVLPGDKNDHADAFVVDVSHPDRIAAAIRQSTVVKDVFERLGTQGISSIHPGFDVLTIRGSEIDRMIELKSSGVDAQVQAMSWNEWKTARGSLRAHFWLYLAGNLRADLQNAAPYLRAVHDPFGTIASAEYEDTVRTRSVQIRVREFRHADELRMEVRSRSQGDPDWAG